MSDSGSSNGPLVFEARVPLPKYKTKKREVLISLNNISKWYRYKKSEIKNNYKRDIGEFLIPEPQEEYEYLVLQYRIVRHIKTRFDQDNIIFAIKFILDLLEEKGYIGDDRRVSIESFSTVVDKSLPETMLDIRVINKRKEWEDQWTTQSSNKKQ